jgi:hypothetical protein
MSDNIITKPDVVSSGNCPIPFGVYTCVFTDAERKTSQKDLENIVAKFEIISPDLVTENEGTPEAKTYSVAGRKGTIYMGIDKAAKNFDAWYGAYERLGLLEADGTLNVDNIIEKLKAKNLYFVAVLQSEETFFTKPGTREPLMYNGKKLSKGFQFSFISAENIQEKTEIDPQLAALLATKPY